MRSTWTGLESMACCLLLDAPGLTDFDLNRKFMAEFRPEF